MTTGSRSNWKAVSWLTSNSRSSTETERKQLEFSLSSAMNLLLLKTSSARTLVLEMKSNTRHMRSKTLANWLMQ